MNILSRSPKESSHSCQRDNPLPSFFWAFTVLPVLGRVLLNQRDTAIKVLNTKMGILLSGYKDHLLGTQRAQLWSCQEIGSIKPMNRAVFRLSLHSSPFPAIAIRPPLVSPHTMSSVFIWMTPFLCTYGQTQQVPFHFSSQPYIVLSLNTNEGHRNL